MVVVVVEDGDNSVGVVVVVVIGVVDEDTPIANKKATISLNIAMVTFVYTCPRYRLL